MNKVLLLIVVLFLAACKTPVQEEAVAQKDTAAEALENVNRYMQERNRELIMAFAERLDWDMEESQTGLWYRIDKKGQGEAVAADRVVVYSYRIRLLDGTLCYAADTTEPKKIVIGRGNVEAGIEEGLLKLREGGSACLIVPPYLAHGNFGDRDKIPGGAVLIVDVEVLRVR